MATFLVQLRDGVGQEIERVEAVRVEPSLRVSYDSGSDQEALRVASDGNVTAETLAEIFGNWWQRATEAAKDECRRRAGEWLNAVRVARVVTQRDLLRELEEWNRASRRAILGDQAGLFAENQPPAVRRRLRDHEQRYEKRRNYLNKRVEFAEPIVESIGVLLRVPAVPGGYQA